MFTKYTYIEQFQNMLSESLCLYYKQITYFNDLFLCLPDADLEHSIKME